jgi:hypothetical protein
MSEIYVESFTFSDGQLYWEEGGEEITLNDLFPQLAASN